MNLQTNKPNLNPFQYSLKLVEGGFLWGVDFLLFNFEATLETALEPESGSFLIKKKPEVKNLVEQSL